MIGCFMRMAKKFVTPDLGDNVTLSMYSHKVYEN